ncbi:hypothetical protein [Umezawaea sp. Da 62-37]|uniref:hypothetical protein n=1 Tax=Umezawaea sp. Da 62-37 TaxID=3075927 RepID=UPI0028F71A94|nr:hypothetical protein [Umezawaea sp. Da 62-37]WNV87546.1 hypothetical protein RM788_04390 [Umezawaea sp. Da 62-37]
MAFTTRSMRPWFAGIGDEPLHDTKTTTLVGDAKDSPTKLLTAAEQLWEPMQRKGFRQ